MEMDIEKLLETANFSRNPAHKEALRQRLFAPEAAPDGVAERTRKLREILSAAHEELCEDDLKNVAGGGAPPPAATESHELFRRKLFEE